MPPASLSQSSMPKTSDCGGVESCWRPPYPSTGRPFTFLCSWFPDSPAPSWRSTELGCAQSSSDKTQPSKCHTQCKGLGAGLCPALALSPRQCPQRWLTPGRAVGLCRCGHTWESPSRAESRPCRIMPLMPSGAETEIPHGSQTRLFAPRNPRPQSHGGSVCGAHGELKGTAAALARSGAGKEGSPGAQGVTPS